MDEHPGVVFRDGPAGRRAVLIGGPDVREVIRALASARHAEPELDPNSIKDLVEGNTGVPGRLIDTALRYWSGFPEEIEAWLMDVEQAEAALIAAWERQQALLAR